MRETSSRPLKRNATARVMLALALLGVLVLFTAQAKAFDVEKVKASSPRVILFYGNGHVSFGSGFVVHAENDYCIVATNFHVVRKRNEAESLYVMRKTPDGKIEARKFEVIWEDKERDLALLKVPGLKADVLPLASKEIAQAEDAYSIGFPGVADEDSGGGWEELYKLIKDGSEGSFDNPGDDALTYMEASVSKGTIRRVITTHWDTFGQTTPIRIIQDDVNIGHGNSGGPLFNTAGQVVGVNTAGVHDKESNDAFNEASAISVLTEQLESQNISYLKGDPVTAVNTLVPAGSGGGKGTTTMLWLVFGVALMALGLAMRKRQAIVESYSHYVRRGGAGRPPARSSPDAATVPPPPGTFAARAEAQTQTQAPVARAAAPAVAAEPANYILEGENPEDHSRVRLAIDEEILGKAKDRVIIGRSEKKAHLCIKNHSISGEHLTLIRRDGRFMIEDRESSNGTSVNGKKLVPHAPVPVLDGDLVLAGDVLLRFRKVTKFQS